MIELDRIYNMECEFWKPAFGYEKYLEVSNKGNVKQLQGKVKTAYGYRWTYI